VDLRLTPDLIEIRERSRRFCDEWLIPFENETEEDYEFKFQRVPTGLTGKEFLAQPADAGPGVPWGGLTSVPPRSAVTTTIGFDHGEYVVGTWPPIRHPMSQIVTVAPNRR